jgi:hypothetical protein
MVVVGCGPRRSETFMVMVLFLRMMSRRFLAATVGEALYPPSVLSVASSSRVCTAAQRAIGIAAIVWAARGCRATNAPP